MMTYSEKDYDKYTLRLIQINIILTNSQKDNKKYILKKCYEKSTGIR